MATVHMSYSFSHLIRDLRETMEIVKKNNPMFLQIVKSGAGVPEATNYKMEWNDENYSAILSPFTAGVSATDTTVPVTDGTLFAVGDEIAFRDGTLEAASRISAIATHDLTVPALTYDHANATVVVKVSHPVVENSDVDGEAIAEATQLFNYTQIFRKDVVVSKTALAQRLYENKAETLIERGIKQKMFQMLLDLNNSCIYGERAVGNATTPRSFRGIIQWLAQAGSLKTDASVADISDTLINDLNELIKRAGGNPTTIVCDTVQARKISAFNETGANRMVVVQETPLKKTYGNYIAEFMGDLPMVGLYKIVVDTNMPPGIILLVNPSKLSLPPLKGRGMQDEDTSLPGKDGIRRTLLTECTFKIENPNNHHGMLYNLKLT